MDTLGRSFGPILLKVAFEPATASQVGRTLTPMLIYILMAAILFFPPRRPVSSETGQLAA